MPASRGRSRLLLAMFMAGLQRGLERVSGDQIAQTLLLCDEPLAIIALGRLSFLSIIACGVAHQVLIHVLPLGRTLDFKT